MKNKSPHTFHIPVMGLAFTIDTPFKVARFGISSVISIIEDQLIEQMREVICKMENMFYEPIPIHEHDFRAKRITAYLNLLQDIITRQIDEIKQEDFEKDVSINQYFEMLPDNSDVKKTYIKMLAAIGGKRLALQDNLKQFIIPGSIDVNIMTKLDKTNYDKDGNELGVEHSDAHSALRGFANSNLQSSIIFSAGMNPRLYSYVEAFSDFFPNEEGIINKRIILKVSDYRSALIQGKFLAKKGLWVSEFRIESGINCGGHAFIADGVLLGPILEEFRDKRSDLYDELVGICNNALHILGRSGFVLPPALKITAQGGIGTADENNFFINNYNLDATGWGSPFLMVPEATNVDDETLQKLVKAKKDDYCLSNSSPLGVPFNNFRASSSENQREMRISKNRPGSPCYKKFLSLNTEFTKRPICTASREYQNLKIKQLQNEISDENILKDEIIKVTQKDCLCEGLGAAALIKNNSKLSHNLSAVAICPGPNLAYFSGIFTLREMLDHIYGRRTILNSLPRPHVFINELQLYIDYLEKEVKKFSFGLPVKEQNYFIKFKENLMKGIEYYNSISHLINRKSSEAYEQMAERLSGFQTMLLSFHPELIQQPAKL